MSSTPKSMDDSLGDSWIDLHAQSCLQSPGRVTPPFFSLGEEYLRLLREAQRESNQSSARVSRANSNRTSLRGSPKSPPNSPNTESNTSEEELKDVYINYYSRDGDSVRGDHATDWIWDWSSRPDQRPPKDWKFIHPKKKSHELENVNVGKIGLFSKEILYSFIVTNILSFIIGTGVGMWLSRRSILSTNIAFD